MKKLFFCLLYFLGFTTPSFASFPEHETREMLHRYCGTCEDPNYYKAASALGHAMRLCFNVWPQNPYFFPEATSTMIDISGDKVFYYEGFLSWETQVPFRSEDDMLCIRTIGRATERDIPVLFFQDENQIWRSNPPVYTNLQQIVDKFAGTGMRTIDLPAGSPGYQEIVNFGEFIGYSINLDTGEKIATTWGKIHYAKDGVHVVPTRPR